MSSPEAILRWYGVLMGATITFAPWVRLLCSGLPDRGATIARPLGLLGMIFPVWFLAGFDLLSYSTAGLWATIAIAGAAGWALVVRKGGIDRAWLGALVASEAVAIVVFLGYVWLRGFTPEINDTEKPMDIALLSASARAESIPPADPWFSGETINYYYLGYLINGSVGRLAGVPTEIGFNLALATTGSMAFVAAAGVGFGAVRRWGGRRAALAAGLGAAFLLVIAGNLYAPKRLLEDPRVTIDAVWTDQTVGIGWRSSRIVCDGPRTGNSCDPIPGVTDITINEFPAFSLLLGDLHPHVMALPFTVAALALALNLVLVGPVGLADRRRLLTTVAATGAIVGSLYALNSWDYPTLLIVVGVGVWVAVRTWPGRVQLVAIGTLVLASVVAWLPFYLDFAAPVGSGADNLPSFLRDVPLVSTLLGTIAAFRGERTSVGEFLTVFGLPYVVGVVLIATGFGRRATDSARSSVDDESPVSFDSLKAVWPFLVVVVVIGLFLPAAVLVLCGAPLILALVQVGRSPVMGPRTIATALFALGFTLLIGTEFFYIQDLFDDRMNTIFKVYYQVWTLFAVATVLAVSAIFREFRASVWTKPALAGIVTIAAVLGLAYPTVAYYQWTDHFNDWQGLNGRSYIGNANPDELAAIEWLDANAGVDDVVLEAAGCSYGNSYMDDVRNNRVSAFTGIPTVIGWGWHETQWRNGQPEIAEIAERQDDVRRMFEDPQSSLFEDYGVTYLYVGSLERLGDPGCDTIQEPYAGVSEPEYPGEGWDEVFTSGDVAIYHRVGTAAAVAP